jgi:UDP:flavonoid glycosyltransferase YjiC (YdhE family)
VASNIDQVMFSRLAARQGAGLLLKEHHVNVSTMREAIATLLSGSTYQTAAKRMQEAIRVWKPEAHFRRLITSILNGAGGIVHDSSDAI